MTIIIKPILNALNTLLDIIIEEDLSEIRSIFLTNLDVEMRILFNEINKDIEDLESTARSGYKISSGLNSSISVINLDKFITTNLLFQVLPFGEVPILDMLRGHPSAYEDMPFSIKMEIPMVFKHLEYVKKLVGNGLEYRIAEKDKMMSQYIKEVTDYNSKDNWYFISSLSGLNINLFNSLKDDIQS